MRQVISFLIATGSLFPFAATGQIKPEVLDGVLTKMRYPYVGQVLLGTKQCTLVLAATNTAITAEHCVSAGIVVPGVIATFDSDRSSKPRLVAKVIEKPSSAKKFNANGADIAVVYLAGLSEYKPRAVIGDLRSTSAFSTILAVGFGLSENENPSNSGPQGNFGQRRSAAIPITSKFCDGKASGGDSESFTYGCEPGRELLAIDPNKQFDACPGDSGGAGIVVDSKNGELAVAIVSKGTKGSENFCKDGTIFTLLSGEVLKNLKSSIPNLIVRSAIRE
jgi:secreted trypsin-like serine protease